MRDSSRKLLEVVIAAAVAAALLGLAALGLAPPVAAQEALSDAQACYAGQIDRCAYAGDAYHEGAGVALSWEMAAQLYRYGCNAGDMRSCRAMGWVHQQTPGHGVPASLSEAHRYYQMACTGGFALACYDLGTLYWTGQGVPVSWPTGQSYYERACGMRHADACREVAFIHGRAMGVPRDHARMAALLRQACELGSTTACDEMVDPVGAATRADADEAGGAVDGGPPIAAGMPEPQFQELLARFRREPGTYQQLALARDLALAGARLSCRQIAAIMQASAIDSTRVRIAATLWPRAVDPQGFHLLLSALEHEGSRTLLRQQTGR